MDRRGGKGRHARGGKPQGFQGGGKKLGRPRPKKDDSDKEEDEAREEIVEQQNRNKGEFFEAFSDSSEEEERMADELEHGESEASECLGAPEFAVNGEYFKTLLKDLRLYALRLEKLGALQRSEALTVEGRAFVEQYERLLRVYSMYVQYYTLLAARGGVQVHPVLRQLASLKLQAKVLDKEFAKHRADADALLARVGRLANEVGDEESGEIGDEEDGDDGEEEGEEEEDEDEVQVKARVRKEEGRARNVAKQAAKQKPKMQVFKLDYPKSYADIHRYAPDDDDEDDDYLKLGAKGKTDNGTEGDITMDDLNSFSNYLKEPTKIKKASSKGKQLYQELSQKKQESKSLANALKGEAEAALEDYERKLMFNERKVKDDQPRTLTEEMLLNRGLRQKRKNVISKVKLRGKYEKAKRLDRVKKGLSLEDGRTRDIHMIKSTGEGVVRDISLN